MGQIEYANGDLLKILKEIPENKEAISQLILKDSALRLYLLKFGTSGMHPKPHTSIIVASSLDELDNILISTLNQDLKDNVRKDYWDVSHDDWKDLALQGSLIPKDIKSGEETSTASGLLYIRPGFFNPLSEEKFVLSYELKDANMVIRVEEINKLIQEKEIHDAQLSRLDLGYIADIVQPPYTWRAY